MCSQQDGKEAPALQEENPWNSGPLLFYQMTLFDLSSINLHSGPY